MTLRTSYLLLLLLLAAGCSSPRDESRDRPAQHDSTVDSVAYPAPVPDGKPMQTTAQVYQLGSHPAGVATDIVYTYSNSSDSSVYLVNCNGDVSPSLQRERGGTWENAWGPATNACLSPAVVIRPGEIFRDTFEMIVGTHDDEFFREIGSADSSRRYRLIWHQALTSFDMNAPPFGEPLPLERRVSNPFVLRPAGGARPDGN